MSIVAAFHHLDGELDNLALELRNFAASKATVNAANDFSLRDECLLEGLLSRVWQAWCGFARECVIGSCIGSASAAGIAIAALPQAISEERVSAAAIKARGQSPQAQYWGSTNTTLRYEPTWGDVDVLNRILTRLRPSNHAQLLAAFSSVSPFAKALQLIRNAAAHRNHQTLAEIIALQPSYQVFRISHPTQALFWVDPTNSDFLVTSAIEGLQDAAEAAVA